MTALKICNGTSWETVPAIQGPQGPRGLPGASGLALLDAQKVMGTGGGYVAATSGQRFKRDAALTQDLAISYTPPAGVDAWWEVTLHVGTVQKLDAAYHYMQAFLGIIPNSVEGVASHNTTKTQHSTVQTFEPQVLTAMFGLSGGTTYQTFGSYGMSGGSWQYNQAAGNLFIHAKAWAR